MEQNYRFCFQENQFWGECTPCTPAVFNRIVDSTAVEWKISTRQAVEAAVSMGAPLDEWLRHTDFKKFCATQEAKPRAGAAFRALSPEQQLVQWTNSLKQSLPCFIFGAQGFDRVPETDRQGNPVLDDNGEQKLAARRLLKGIRLSGLFMFDADHSPIPPYEIYRRTLVPDFPWNVRLAHVTSSGEGLRLVCEARPELGNIADNQICLARDLSLTGLIGTTGKPVVDDSCIDASRISYAPRRKDIYFIDEEGLFNNKKND